MKTFTNGVELRELRKSHGLSQSKLADITGIVQARLSSYELGKNGLKENEVFLIQQSIDQLDEGSIRKLKVKRYREHTRTGDAISSRPRRNYTRTINNIEYLAELTEIENKIKKTKTDQHTPKAISLFSGCGGLCYGVKAAGFNIVGASELYEGYRKIYKLNFPEVPLMTNDVTKITEEECTDIINREGHIDMIAGGPPCQGFSLTGKRNPEDARNALFQDYLRVAKTIKPKIVLMENVRLLTSMKTPKGCFVTDSILNSFSEIGYQAAFFCLNAKDYGVPQHRERVIFIAVRNNLHKTPSIPEATHGLMHDLFYSTKPYRTFGDAVSDLEFIESGEKSNRDDWHAAVSHPEHVIEWLVDVPQGCSAHENKLPEMRPPSGYNTTYKRQVWDEPGATVATTFAMISGCRNVHPIATRSLTIREATRLQSFPDSFILKGTTGDIRSTIGNAVPPLFAHALAIHIINTYIL